MLLLGSIITHALGSGGTGTAAAAARTRDAGNHVGAICRRQKTAVKKKGATVEEEAADCGSDIVRSFVPIDQPAAAAAAAAALVSRR